MPTEMLTDTQVTLQTNIADLLRRAASVEGDARAGCLRDAAERVVDLRETFLMADGRRDYRGATRAYKEAVGAAYDKAAADKQLRDTLRWHVKNALVARLGADKLAEYGIDPLTGVERHDARRQTLEALAKSATDAALARASADGDEPMRSIRALSFALAQVKAIRSRELGKADDEARATAARIAAALVAEAARVQRAVQPRV